MVILSQIRSFTSSPDLGVARAFAILYMGVVSVSFTRSPVCVCGGGGILSQNACYSYLISGFEWRLIDCE